MYRHNQVLPTFLVLLTATLLQAEEKKTIPVARIERESSVDFQSEVLPILKKKCIACHNEGEPKGDLVLETPQTILEGGRKGPTVQPGNGAESKLILLATHAKKPFMPPKKNRMNAKPLTPKELGLIKLWIDQGATGEVRRETSKLQWHPLPAGVNPIYTVAVSPDGQYVACGRANQIFIYHVRTGRFVTRLTDPALLESGLYSAPGVADLDSIQSLAFHPDGALLASGGYRTVKLWRRPQNQLKLTVAEGGAAITALTLSPDGKQVATGTPNGKVQLWDLSGDHPGGLFEAHTAEVTGLDYSHDGTRLFSSSLDGSVGIWKAPDGSPLHRLDAPAPINGLQVAGKDTRVVAACEDGSIQVWGLPQGELEKAPVHAGSLDGHEKSVTAVAKLSGAEIRILSGGEDGTLRLWDLTVSPSGGQEIQQLKHGAPVVAVAVRPDGKAFASIGTDKITRLWNAESGEQIAEMKGDHKAQHIARVHKRKVDFKKGNHEAAKGALTTAEEAVESKNKQVEEKKLALEKLVAEQKSAAESVAKKAAEAEEDEEARKKREEADEKKAKEDKLARSSAERVLEEANELAEEAAEEVVLKKAALLAAAAELRTSEAELKKATRGVELAEKTLHALAFSGDGLKLVGAGEGGLIHTWSGANGAVLETLQSPGAAVQALVCDAEGDLVSGASDGGLFVWDLDPSWELERVIGSPDDPSDFVDRVTALDFSSDGLLLAAGSGEPSRGGELKILRVEDGSLVHNLPTAHSDTIFAVEFSPNGKHVASGGADKFLKVFDVDSGEQVRSFEGHTHHVLGVSWKAESKVLASAGADTVIKVWNMETGDQIRTIEGFGKQVTALQFVSFSPLTIACSGDKSVRQHNTDSGKQARNFEGGANYLYAVDISEDGRIVASGGYSSVLRLWDAESGKVLLTFDPSQN